MKFILLCVLGVAVGGKLKDLVKKIQESKDTELEKTSVVAGVFDVAGFDDEETSGRIAIKVCTQKPKKIHLSKAQQTPNWIDINDVNSPMQSGKWRPAANGFRFQNQQGEQLHCAASEGKPVADALLIGYSCQSHVDQGSREPRFSQISNKFWLACPDGHVPYGWPAQWGDFDFPYYAITDTGVLGCAYVSDDGYCFETKDGAAIHANFGYNDSPSNLPVSFFPYDSFHASDLIPGSRFYTSTQPSRGVVIRGSTTNTQPSQENFTQPQSTSEPSATLSTQPVPPPPIPDTLHVVPSSSSPPFEVAPRFRARAPMSTSSPPFNFVSRDSVDAKAQVAAQREEELESSFREREEEQESAPKKKKVGREEDEDDDE